MSRHNRKIKANSVDILTMHSNVDVEESPKSSRNAGDQGDGTENQGRKIRINAPQVIFC